MYQYSIAHVSLESVSRQMVKTSKDTRSEAKA